MIWLLSKKLTLKKDGKKPTPCGGYTKSRGDLRKRCGVKMRSKRKTGGVISISEAMRRVLPKINPSAGRLQKIMELWKQILGEKVFIHARPTTIRKATLYVTVSEPVWKGELLYCKRQLIDKINEGLPDKKKIRDIVIRTGYLEGVRKQVDIEKRERKEMEKNISALPVQLRQAVEGLKDEKLKESVVKLASHINRLRAFGDADRSGSENEKK